MVQSWISLKTYNIYVILLSGISDVETIMVIQGPKIGRQPDKEIEHFEKPDRANRIRGNRKISSKFIFGISVGNWICC